MEMMNSLLELNLKVGLVSMAALLGWLYIGDAELSLNELMITEGYAWAYDGGTKQRILKTYVRYVGLLAH